MREMTSAILLHLFIHSCTIHHPHMRMYNNTPSWLMTWLTRLDDRHPSHPSIHPPSINEWRKEGVNGRMNEWIVNEWRMNEWWMNEWMGTHPHPRSSTITSHDRSITHSSDPHPSTLPSPSSSSPLLAWIAWPTIQPSQTAARPQPHRATPHWKWRAALWKWKTFFL